jgi:protein-tyrosine phosphatase
MATSASYGDDVDAVTALPTRHVACDNAFNVRDLGGYRTADDRTIRWRTLFRADGIHRALDSTALLDLGLRTVIDLRSPAEIEVGMYRASGTAVVHLPVLDQTWDPATLVDDGDHVAFLADRYVEMLDQGAAAFAASVEILAAGDRLPAVFHCSAGKDRTGVLAALVLSALGVSDHQVAADYHLSALAMDQLVEWLQINRPDLVDVMAEQPKHFLACPPEAMLALLDHLHSHWGSAEVYLVEAGVAPEALGALRANLLDG